MICDGINISAISIKANRTLGFLRRNLYACPQEVKEAAYKGLVCPVLEYSSSVWDPSGIGFQDELEKIQNRVARFVTGNYNNDTGSMTGILGHWKWEPPKHGGWTVDTYCYTKVWRVKPVYQQLTLFPRLGAAWIIIRRHFRSPSLIQIFISVAPPPHSPRPLGIGMYFQTLLPHLLKLPRMELLSSLLWWELGTNLPGPGPGVWLSFWRCHQ